MCDQKLRPNIPNWWQSYEVRSAFIFPSPSPSVKSKDCKMSSGLRRCGGLYRRPARPQEPGRGRGGLGGEESADSCRCFWPRHYG